jgi:release factor glutamine methyltransferase
MIKQQTIFDQQLLRLQETLETLVDKPEENPDNTLRALWCMANGKPRSVELAEGSELGVLDDSQLSELKNLVSERLKGTPLAHITHRQRFMGIELIVGDGALVPRKETEILARCAIQKLQEMAAAADEICVIDVCTGAGNLPISYALSGISAKIYAADLSGSAVGLARMNVAFHALESQVEVFEGDLLESFDSLDLYGKVDLLSCNPPYISSAKVPEMHQEISDFEPSLAFDGGPFGIKIIQKLIKESPRYLRPGGWLVFEVGEGQAPMLVKRLGMDKNFCDIETGMDDAGIERVIMAKRNK